MPARFSTRTAIYTVMDARVTDGMIIARLDPGEEVIDRLEALRDEYDIAAGFFTAIGAVDRAVLGHYDVEDEAYTEERFSGQFEVTNCTGNIGPDKIHAHITLADDDFRAFGGHLAEARVSGTFEIVIHTADEPLTHHPDDRTGLDVFAL